VSLQLICQILQQVQVLKRTLRHCYPQLSTLWESAFGLVHPGTKRQAYTGCCHVMRGVARLNPMSSMRCERKQAQQARAVSKCNASLMEKGGTTL
jgi:hypothetical protein